MGNPGQTESQVMPVWDSFDQDQGELFERQVFRETEVKGFDTSSYQTVQVFYPSKDGTKIPMFIIHKKVSGLPKYVSP